MQKKELTALFGTLEQVGEIFAPFNKGKPLSKGAISQWPDEGDIPPLREYQIRELIPDIDERIARAKQEQAA